jgi:hypothetical protein
MLASACGRIAFDEHAFDPALCPASYDRTIPNSEHRYRVNSTPLMFEEAAAACVADTATSDAYTHLVVLSDLDEFSAITPFSGGGWVGLTDRRTEGDFVPITLENVDGYGMAGTSVWALNEPNNSGDEDCTQVKTFTPPELNDMLCALPLESLCECDDFPDEPSQY